MEQIVILILSGCERHVARKLTLVSGPQLRCFSAKLSTAFVAIRANSWNFSFLATKSVSQFNSTSALQLFLTPTPIRPCVVCLPSSLVAFVQPSCWACSRSHSSAYGNKKQVCLLGVDSLFEIHWKRPWLCLHFWKMHSKLKNNNVRNKTLDLCFIIHVSLHQNTFGNNELWNKPSFVTVHCFVFHQEPTVVSIVK